MDDLKSFTYVLAVAECKSISKAAELLYISQPSLSRFISSLEPVSYTHLTLPTIA